jgi:excisionase family DNA binding protein
MTEDRLTIRETKTARMMVLYRLRLEGQLDGLSDADLGRALHVDRTTIWKDKQALKRADQLYNQVMARQPWADKPGLTVQEAAAALGCDQGTITGMIRGGLVSARKTRGRWRIPAAEVDRLKKR